MISAIDFGWKASREVRGPVEGMCGLLSGCAGEFRTGRRKRGESQDLPASGLAL
jgi:hypothetical protein